MKMQNKSRVGVGWVGRCQPRIEVILKMKKKAGGPLGGVGSGLGGVGERGKGWDGVGGLGM